jgi:hypothetical protein
VTVALDYPPAYIDAAYRWVPPGRRGSYGPEIVDFMTSIGHGVDQEQADDIDALASYGAGGTYLALETCDLEARQNGKTDRRALPIAMADVWLFGHEVTWSAHRLETVQDVFKTVKLLIEANDSLSRRVKAIIEQRAEWGVELHSGALIEFRVRGGGGGRGVPRDIWVVDEALYASASSVGDRLPTLSTRPNPQVRYVSSACKASSIHLWSVVQRGRAGGDPSLIFLERCAPGGFDDPPCELGRLCPHLMGTEGCALDREEFWHLANHRAARPPGPSYQFLRGERRTMPPTEFAREIMGWHEKPVVIDAPPITVEAWRSRLDPESAVVDDGRVVLAAEIALDRKSGSIAAAGWRPDGKAHVGLVAHDGGTEWLLPRLIELTRAHKLHEIKRAEKRGPAVILDPTSPAGTLIDPLRQAGVEPVLMTAREVATSCGDMQDALTDGTVWHRDTPAVDVAIGGAVRRDLGDGGWALGRRKSAAVSVDITPAVVVFNARWGLTQAIKDYDVLASVR